MLNAYLYLFYPILLHLARGFGKKYDENRKYFINRTTWGLSRAGQRGVSPANGLGWGPGAQASGRNQSLATATTAARGRKQGEAVGAAASKTQAIAKRMLGAATRRCSRRKLPAGLLTTIAVTVSFQLTVLIQAHPHPKAGERCAF